VATLWQLLRGAKPSVERRSGLDDLLEWKRGSWYGLGGASPWLKQEDIENSFTGYVNSAYKSNGVVFATMLARLLIFSEARFQWQRITAGRPGDLFGTPELSILETPWPNATTGELLSRADQDASFAGNFYVANEGSRLRRLRADWVSIILTAPAAEAVQSDIAGYLFRPGGLGSGAQAKTYLPHEVAHWSPIPDPDAQYRGMSWLTPILREIQADKAATAHKQAFFDNGATLGPVVSLKESVTVDQFKEFMVEFREGHQGTNHAYEPLFLGGGADVTMQTADMKQLDFRATQGAGETRITAAGGVPAVIVGLSEGLQAATYSNFGQARRKFGDHWARPMWRSIAAALAPIVPVPRGTVPGTVRLWYDDRDIAFLREDQMDAAEIAFRQAQTVRSLIDGGMEPDAAVRFASNQDLSSLIGHHTGLYSVQLQPPGTGIKPDAPAGGSQ
jgi:phage portal protein BeeE